jgi:tetratricopeptide (TPR) repeat protein
MSVSAVTVEESPLVQMIDAARQLAGDGADEPAKRAYLDVLRRDPTSLPALLDLARLALRTGHRTAAMTAYQQAIFCHPEDPVARVNLANLLIESGEFEAARDHFAAALAGQHQLAAAHQGMARVLTALGDPDAAALHWRSALADGGFAPQPYGGAGQGIPVLLLVSVRGGNIPTRSLLDDTVFAVTALYAEHHDPARPLPPHALIFNAIGDADLCSEALANAGHVGRRSSAPVINPPELVSTTGRAAVAARLAGLADIVAPAVSAVRREHLLTDANLSFPRLFRSPGFHTGQHFVRVERREDLAAAITDLPGDELLAIEPLDARGPDGQFRKYRAMLIKGAAYPLHLAISATWKVHYFSADMAKDEGHRTEEAAFLADMPETIGPRAMAALAAIAAELGLDYAGVDFAVAPDGRLVLFEANAGMVISPPGPEAIWDYRRAPTQRALAAVIALLLSKAAGQDAGVRTGADGEGQSIFPA